MTDWQARRLGKWARPRERGKRREAQNQPPAAAPLILTVTIRNSARDHAEKAVEALAELMGKAASEHVRVAAANALLDRAVGKPLSGAQAAAEDAASEDEDVLEVRWLNLDGI